MIIAVALVLSLAMLVVIYLDATSFRIPNWLNLALLVLFPVWGFLYPNTDWLSSLYMFLALFAAGYLMFICGIMGGGDVKLMAVCGLYVGFGETGMLFVFYTAIMGGILSIAILLARLMVPAIGARLGVKSIPKIFTMGAEIPYGLAIAGAFLALIWTNKLPGLMIG